MRCEKQMVRNNISLHVSKSLDIDNVGATVRHGFQLQTITDLLLHFLLIILSTISHQQQQQADPNLLVLSSNDQSPFEAQHE